ncbi:MAG TPA: hypothetical protein PKE48_08530, partial [Anaerolineales bacterium]|nr:hypothetical protein [Anaerolineales bacterium]
ERNFLITYVQEGILVKNPFQTLDRNGVGKLMQRAILEGRATRPELEVGICGEHGGDPDSIEWCHIIGNNYVSCSPFRVPVARLAAAHAALKHMPAKKAAARKPAVKKAVAKKVVAKKVVKKAVKKGKK